jgi:putative ribosome biogenesis GTPase RsgA
LADLQASIAASKETVTSKNIEIATIALEQAVNTGDTAAAAAAAKAIAKAQGGGASTQAANTISLLQSATPQPTLTAAQVARGDQIKWVGGANGSWQVIKGTNVVSDSSTSKPIITPVITPGSKKETRREMIGSGLSRILRVYYDDGTFQDFSASETPSDKPVVSSSSDPATIALIQSLQNQIASLTAGNSQAAIDKAAADAAAKKEKAESAIAVLTERFTKYNLASLVPKIKELAIGGAGESTITLQLQETEEYKQRFRANQKRIEKGLRVLAPGDYLGMEDDYRQILRAYGLKQFDNDDYVTQFISNDISDTELTNRVVTAVQRVQNADPAILNTLRSFYGISDNDLVAYVLDPNQQFQKIERQVAAAEIGAAAKLQGINAGVAVSEQLAAQGVTKAQAQKGYATIADILPTAEKLSDIYGSTLDEYRIGEAEQEVFNTLASAQRKRQKLIQTEIASFSGASGLGKSSLSSQLGGTY